MRETSASVIIAFACIFGMRAYAVDDLRLWYRQPATKWSESLFNGHGRLGGAVRGGVRQALIDSNEDTLWSGESHAPAVVQRTAPSSALLVGCYLAKERTRSVSGATCPVRYGEKFLQLATQPGECRSFDRSFEIPH